MDRIRAETIPGTAASCRREISITKVRGRGPDCCVIAGATGDAGHFEQAADVLAAEHTVITYDRRGNSRSRPTGRARSISRPKMRLRCCGMSVLRQLLCSERAAAPSLR